MTQEMHAPPIIDDDTPPQVDEVPPYGDPFPWGKVLLGALIAVGILVAVWAGRKAWRVAGRLLGRLFTSASAYEAPPRTMPGEWAPAPDPAPPAGVFRLYRVRLFDDGVPGSGVAPYEQLTRRPLRYMLDMTEAPDVINARLAGLAAQLAAEVRRQDGEICVSPRITVEDEAGRQVGECRL